MEGLDCGIDWLSITNLVCNTMALIALAYISARYSQAEPRRRNGN